MNKSKSLNTLCRREGEGDVEGGAIIVEGAKEDEYSACEEDQDEGQMVDGEVDLRESEVGGGGSREISAGQMKVEEEEEEVINEIYGSSIEDKSTTSLEREGSWKTWVRRRSSSLWSAEPKEDSEGEVDDDAVFPDAVNGGELLPPGERNLQLYSPGPGVFAGVAVVFFASYLVVNNFTAAIYAFAKFTLRTFINLAVWISS